MVKQQQEQQQQPRKKNDRNKNRRDLEKKGQEGNEMNFKFCLSNTSD